MKIELLWIDDCPCYQQAEELVRGVLAELDIEAEVELVEVPDEQVGNLLRFPGSPTVRIDGDDVEPDYEPCEQCTPRCRVYASHEGLGCLPQREWVIAAVRAAVA